jgi:hypothetical protein
MKLKWYPNFSQWTRLQVVSTFGLTKANDQPDFVAWLEAPAVPLHAVVVQLLDQLRELLDARQHAWNETELLANFIAPVLQLVQFSGEGYSLYLERTLTVEMSGGVVGGQVDALVASGLDQPEAPYFFIHEYKRARAPEADPQGQLLITMLAAQHLDPESDPLYGCYIVGRIWTFVYLTGRTFAESQGYDASDPGELRTVLAILHDTKRRIEARVAAAG